ncbi:MAG: type II secretion system F family protein [Nitriliruptoraceae bacterium]
MKLVLATALLALAVGLSLVLTELRWFRAEPIARRVGYFLPHARQVRSRAGVLSGASLRELFAPAIGHVAERVSRLLGIQEDVGRRLQRLDLTVTVAEFRLRQATWAGIGALSGALASSLWGASAIFAAAFTVVGAALGFVLIEQRLIVADQGHRASVAREVPVIAEQIGMLIASGYSTIGAVDRVTERGHGLVSRDLRRCILRIRQGASERQAFSEWAELAQVESVTRFVGILALEKESTDLGRLISNEARSMRRALQRELLEHIEKRGQQVWIPVTVAALVPGAIFIGVPFSSALRGFLSG